MTKALSPLRILVFLIIILLVVSCGGAQTTSTTPTTTTTAATTYLFPLIPHELGEPPKIPHLYIAAYKTCDLCHIDKSTPISSIKIDEFHTCNECHKLRDSTGDVGPCQETIVVKYTCIFDYCHTHP
jgi:hypothetical protein